MSETNGVDVSIAIVNDSVYAPLYIDGILSALSGSDEFRFHGVYTVSVTNEGRLWKQVKRRLGIYGFRQFLLFTAIVLKSGLLSVLERWFRFKRPYSIQRVCQTYGVQCLPVSSVNDDSFVQRLRKGQQHVLLSIAVGELFKKRTREAVAYPLNIHSSLLPKYAGIMGLFWAVLHGETEAGVSIFIMGKKFDDGDIIGQTRFNVTDVNSLHRLFLRAVERGSRLAVSTLKDIARNRVNPVPQDMKDRSYFSLPVKADRKKFFARGYRFFRLRDLFN